MTKVLSFFGGESMGFDGLRVPFDHLIGSGMFKVYRVFDGYKKTRGVALDAIFAACSYLFFSTMLP